MQKSSLLGFVMRVAVIADMQLATTGRLPMCGLKIPALAVADMHYATMGRLLLWGLKIPAFVASLRDALGYVSDCPHTASVGLLR